MKRNSLGKGILGKMVLVATLIALSVNMASSTSVNVVAIGGYDGSASGSGGLPHAGTDFAAFTFATLAPGAVTSASLASYDTAVLNMASSAMGCNANTLSSTAKAAINAFAANGGKVIIQDAECTFNGAVDYTWLTFPFTTSNPGAWGAMGGTLTIVEQDGLATSTPGPKFIDTNAITSQTDAVGDMNVVITKDSNWCLSMTGTNVQKKTGATQMYAKPGNGLFIYNGLDTNYINGGPYGQGTSIDATGGGQLRKIWLQWLQVSNTLQELPCGVVVSGIGLSPLTATNPVGTTHTVTATVTANGIGQANVVVTFNVISGPNVGATGTSTTNANGQATFTYSDTGGAGTDTIQASFTNQTGQVITSQPVTKKWIQTNNPPVAVPGGPYTVNEGSAVAFDGSASYDPDVGDSIASYAWDFGDGSMGASGAKPTHTYANNGVYTVTLTVTDTHGATNTASTTATVVNVAPTVNAGPGATINEGDTFSSSGSFSDPGTTETWTATVDYGDGSGVQPLALTGKNFALSHTYTINGAHTVAVKVTDSSGGTGSATAVVTVNNVAPTVTLASSYFATVPITLRIAGQGDVGNSVELQVIQDGAVIASTKITRTPGSPNAQEATVSATIDLSKPYSGHLIFDTEAAISGGTPVWVIVDGVSTKVTTFNTQKNDPASYHQTFDFKLAPLISIVGKEITFKATASDPGSDPLTFKWDFGDGGILINPYPLPNPVTDKVTHTYTAAGSYTINLKVDDGDGGVGTASMAINIS